jgi:alanine dehydrogenase
MKIGCVKEIKKHEYRVGMTPDNVKSYTSHNHEVYVEKGLGISSAFSDEEYIKAGAGILDKAADVWEIAGMLIKVKEPLQEEYKFMKEGQILYTYLHLAADLEQTNALLSSRTKGVAYETLTDNNGGLPLLRPMSEIAGRLSIQEGAKYLEKPFGGRGVLLGGVTGVEKGKVVIIGGGIVGTNACKIAVGLGADVTIIDLSIDRLTYLDDIFGSRIQTIYSTEVAIKKALADADLVIGGVLIPGRSAPKLIKKEYLKDMMPGSVIVDVAVDQGGCCETTKATYHDNPTFVVDGVVHYCVANMPGATPRTSTVALTNATLYYGLLIADNGLEKACKLDNSIVSAINTYAGKCTCKNVAESLGINYTNVNELTK